MKLEDIYTAAPIWVQNLMVTGYGAKLYYERYFNQDKEFLRFLLANQGSSFEEIRVQQTAWLKSLLVHAGENVEHYRESFKQAGFEPRDLRSLEDLQLLPLLSKETLRTAGDRMLAGNFTSKQVVTLNTSGTTGKSLKISVDLASRRKAYDFVTRYHNWAGLENSRNNATFGGRTIVPQSQKSRKFWRYNAVMGNYLFSTYHLSEENLPHYINKLREVQPRFIESYPSAVYIVAKFMEEHGLAGIRPKAVLTSGETLFDHQREVVERVFGCKLFDQYGCTEQALFVSQCEEGTYHAHPEYGIVEILDDDDAPVGPGVVGRVVCTSFVNSATPLIRYDLGDTACWSDGKCRCGRNFPIVKEISGRKDDYVVKTDGTKIGRLDPVFKAVDSVQLAQIVQLDLKHVVVKLVPGSTYCREDRDNIVAELQKRVGEDMSIAVEEVADIAKTNNGKFRAVISHVR